MNSDFDSGTERWLHLANQSAVRVVRTTTCVVALGLRLAHGLPVPAEGCLVSDGMPMPLLAPQHSATTFDDSPEDPPGWAQAARAVAKVSG
jgi:hypothetical protein